MQYLHTKEPSRLQASDCRCWWFVTELLHGIYRYNGSKCIEDKDAIQKYLSTDRKLERYLQGQAHFYANIFWESLNQEKKNYFQYDTIIAAAFP